MENGKLIMLPNHGFALQHSENAKANDAYSEYGSERNQPILQVLWLINIDCHKHQNQKQQGPIVEKTRNQNPKSGIKNLGLDILQRPKTDQPSEGHQQKETAEQGIVIP